MTQITLAMAKGRTAKDSLALLEQAGISFPDFNEKSRKLVFYSQDKKVKMIYVKAIDVTTYVEQGAADVGIVGKDNILEADADLYELLDLNLGLCRFVVASLSKEPIKKGDSLKVASKYTHVTENFFTEQEVNVETIKLNGSVELAPLIDMADAIVDIVETGTTIKENGLTILDEIAQISTRVVVNKASFATKTEAIKDFITKLKKVVE